MKTLIKWFIKKFATVDTIKSAVRSANAKLAQAEAGDRAARIMGYGNDASEIVAAYLAAFSNDGKMDEAELATVNEKTDATIDKYLTDETLGTVIDAIFA